MSSNDDPQRPAQERTISAASSSSHLLLSSSPISIPNIPPRRGSMSENTTPARRLSPRPSQNQLGTSPLQVAGTGLAMAENSTSAAAGNGNNTAEDLTDAQKARIVARHLVDAQGQAKSRKASESAGNNSKSSDNVMGKLKDALLGGKKVEEEVLEDQDGEGDESGPKELTVEDFPMPFAMQGGDVTHDLYKWQRNAIASPANLKRSKSTGELSIRSAIALRDEQQDDTDEDDPLMTDIKKMREPGGFRRNYINRKISQAPTPDDSGTVTPANGAAARPAFRKRATGSFVDFLSLYGHLAGEELEEIDEEEEDEEDRLEAAEQGIPTGTPASQNVNERTPLLKRQDTRARIAKKRVSMEGKTGDATVLQAVMMLLKSFVGTGILFLGKAFFNGGMLFSIVVLLSVAGISLYSFLLLVDTRLVVPGSFGDMGGVLYGPWLRIAILTSITLSQIGFVAAYTIFVAENLQAFVLAVTDCRVYIPIAAMIFAQCIAYLPLAMFRNIHKLSGTALIADAFILIGIVYIVYLEVGHLKEYGLGDIVPFNPKSFPLLIGTAVFAFEGVGLVIPITEAMREPHKFPKVLSWVMLVVAILFGGSGALGYATFGSDIQTVVLVNLPQDDRMVNVVQFLYSIAIMLSTPLQLFPAVRIMEQGIFSSSGKYSNRVKWQKNLFRSLTVLGCACLSWAGASDLDKFVSLIGSIACVPLCFCYPPMLHYKACAQKRWQKVLDLALIAFGFTMLIYTGGQTIDMLFNAPRASSPKLGKCPVPS